MNTNQFFTTYPFVRMTKGYYQALIVDLFKENGFIVPNKLIEVIELYDSEFKIKEILDGYSKNESEVLNGYFKFLLSNDLIFTGNKQEVRLFKIQNDDDQTPFNFVDAIIERSHESNYALSDVLCELNELFVQHVEIRYLDKSLVENDITKLKEFLDLSNLDSIQIFAPYEESLISIIKNFDLCKRIKFTLYDSPENRTISMNNEINIHLIKQKSVEAENCGQVNSSIFIFNTEFYTQSLKRNTCLSKKISFSKDGQIKNCPSCVKSFGKIGSCNLNELAHNQDFTRLWNLTKDNIDVCKDCEYRHVCSDCRVFVEGNEFSKPSKCNYNPYVGKWKGELGFQSIEEFRSLKNDQMQMNSQSKSQN